MTMKRRFDMSEQDQQGVGNGSFEDEYDPFSGDASQAGQTPPGPVSAPAQPVDPGHALSQRAEISGNFSLAEQETKSLKATRSSAPVKSLRRVRFAAQAEQRPAAEASITGQETPAPSTAPVEEETKILPSLPAATGGESSGPAGARALAGQLPVEQVEISDQDTRPLLAISPTIPLEIVRENRYIRKAGPVEQQSTIADLETKSLAAIQGTTASSAEAKPVDPPQGMFRRMLHAGLVRLQEPQPEGLLTRGLQAVKREAGLGLVPLLALTNALGLLLVSFSYYLSVWEYSYPVVESCFMGGLLLMVVPNLVRLLSRSPARLERICLVCVLGFVSYFVHFMSSPAGFSSFDDFLHWRTVIDILQTGHLFSVNSMLPVSPYYPGLELITSAISSTTGLSAFQAGVIVTITAHFLMVLALYLFYEYITNSSRMASIAVMVYVANPHFLFFDTIFSYETLALPLAILMIYILARYGDADKNHRRVIVTAWIVLLAVTITHHMTDYIFDGLLALWAGISFFRPVPRKTRIYLTVTAVLGILLSVSYAFFLPGNPVWSYLSEYFGSAFGQLEQIITGSGSARPLFTSAVQAPPIWDKLLITGSIALVTFSLPFGLLNLQRLHRNNALAVTLGIASLLYPLTQAFRFTSFGTEITDRAAAFLFLPIAYLLTVLLTHFWPTRQLTRRSIALISSAILVIFLGNVVVATSPNLTGIPGPYLVVADARSVEPEGINAALWSLTYLGSSNRVATDRINQMLMSTYGDQRIVTRLNDNIDVAPIFYSANFDDADIAILQTGKIHYLMVDTRISTALPLEGTYFENDVPRSIISKDSLTKFNNVAQIDRLFDSGDIVVYDTGAFLAGSGP